MPFVLRTVRPKDLVSRGRLFDDEGRPKLKDGELEAVTNLTLSNALRQLASVVQIAKQVFDTLNTELEQVARRTGRLRERIDTVQRSVHDFDPKAVTVPESDLTEFSGVKDHFKSRQDESKELFTSSSRPPPLCRLYLEAAATPVPLIRHLDAYRQQGVRSSKYFSVTPILSNNRKKPQPDLDIETRKPAVVDELRRWTSSEAIGSVTVDPDCTLRINPPEKDVSDHTLPSPEEQLQAVALKFPAEVVCVDVTGKNFLRMTNLRRSLMHVELEGEAGTSVRKRTRSRRPRGKRRNTIAGTDSKELEAVVGDSSDTNFGKSTPEDGMLTTRTAVAMMNGAGGGEKKSHLENLKEWGKSRLRQIRNTNSGSTTGGGTSPTESWAVPSSSVKLRTSNGGSRRKWEKDELNPHSSSGNWSASSESGHSSATSHIPSERHFDCRSSVSSGSVCLKHKRPTMVSTSSSVTSESTLTPDDGETGSMYSCDTEGYYTSFHLDSGLKTLREEEPCPAMHSTSALSVDSHANISALTADSEYELFGKGSTSTTASSNGTVCTTLLVPPAPSVPERVSSQLSGTNTLPERNSKSGGLTDLVKRETQSLKLDKKSDVKMSSFCADIKNDSKSEDQRNYRKEATEDSGGRTKNERCMITVDVHHGDHDRSPEKCGDSPDSGHNTCSSPVDSVASPSIDLEMSECSDLEGVDRVERIRVKTTINSSRIPSMCVITPPQSDDEISLNQYQKSSDPGEYVTIADCRRAAVPTAAITPVPASEYISLNELPPSDSLERRRKGARVTLDAEGKVVYSSDSLRRKKTTGTFEPGPCVASTNSPVPPRQINVRPVQLQTPTTKQTTKENLDSSLRRPLSPERRTVSPLRNPSLSNGKRYFPKSVYDRVSPIRPVSPLVSPPNRVSSPPVIVLSTQKATSPKMVVRAKTLTQPVTNNSSNGNKGAYVRVAEEDPKLLVKRSDSYKMANTQRLIDSTLKARKQFFSTSPAASITTASLSPLSQAASNNKAVQLQSKADTTPPPGGDSHNRSGGGQWTWPRSTSTPTKNNGATSPSPMDFTTVPSPIQNQQPKSTRSAMDLFAIIHESKKRIQSLQKQPTPPPPDPTSIPGKANEILGLGKPNKMTKESMKNLPRPMAPLNMNNRYTTGKLVDNGFRSLPRMKVQMLEESPKNLLQRKIYARSNLVGDVNKSLAADRHGPTQPTSRNDFKRLLLQKGCGSSPVTKESAVERLKNKNNTLKPTWKFDVLSTTIPEDCSDEDEQLSPTRPPNNNKLNSSATSGAVADQLMKSSTLVNAQNRMFQARGSPTLETAL